MVKLENKHKKYIHRKIGREHIHYDSSESGEKVSVEILRYTLVPYGGREVLAVQKRMKINDGNPNDFVIVPGYVLSTQERISIVEPLTREEDKSALRKIISKETVGLIIFEMD